MKLTFTKGNAKLNHKIVNFSLPAGYTCPGAHACLSWADRTTGKIRDSKDLTLRCFSASQEAAFPNVRKSRWDNFTKLKQAISAGGINGAVELITSSLPKNSTIVRVHVSGDFFSQEYFDAWLEVAKTRQDIKFYAYTKSLNFWKERHSDIPANFELTASHGGKWDAMINENALHSVVVVNHPDEANGLVIDHDDSNAYKENRPRSFALLIHGVQPKGSKSSDAVKRLKKENIQFSYSKPKKQKSNEKINKTN